MNPGQMLKQIRLYRGQTISQLAEKTNLTKQRISSIENSDDVTFSTFQKIIDALEFEIIAYPREHINKVPTGFKFEE